MQIFQLRFGLLALAALSGCGSDPPANSANAGGTASAGQSATNAGAAGQVQTQPAGGAGAGGASGTSGAAGTGLTAGTGGAASGGGDSSGGAGSGGQPANAGPVKHRWLTSVAHPGPLAIITDTGATEWSLDITDESNDAWVLPSGNILHAYKTGVREITPTKAVVWDYPAPAGSEMHGCQPLDNGHFLAGEAHDAGLAYLREIDGSGAVTATVTVQAETPLSAHDQFREVRKTPQGTYLVAYMGYRKARELDAQGKTLREFPCGMFVATRLPNLNTLIACGDDHRVIEVDPQDKIVWEVGEKDIPGNYLGFAAGVQRLANGNTVIANWSGHGGDPNQPQVFELTPDKKVVWEVKDPALKLVSMVEILDPAALVQGKPLR